MKGQIGIKSPLLKINSDIRKKRTQKKTAEGKKRTKQFAGWMNGNLQKKVKMIEKKSICCCMMKGWKDERMKGKKEQKDLLVEWKRVLRDK